MAKLHKLKVAAAGLAFICMSAILSLVITTGVLDGMSQSNSAFLSSAALGLAYLGTTKLKSLNYRRADADALDNIGAIA